MTNTKPNSTPGGTDDDLDTTRLFELLANDRRRLALHYLTQTVGAVHVGDLADQIALWEGDHTHEHYERICTSLVHIHIPKLTDAGVMQYDPEQETVELLEVADQLVPHLDLAAPADTQ